MTSPSFPFDPMAERFVYTVDDVMRVLDALIAGGDGVRWGEFYADRDRPCPFFTDRPDENLAEWFANGLLRPGRVLELGCGNGRNATYLAGLGCEVDAVDISAQAIAWARERADAAGARVGFQCCSIFEAAFAEGTYDLVYDAGCFHHLAPHRRRDYVALVERALRPGGSYGLVCFRPEGGSGLTDQQVYERRSLGGGLGYSQDRLGALWDSPPFRLRVLRQMAKAGPAEPCFGEDFLWVLLAARDGPR
jgi:SAM-dependent methyltransferase